MNITPIYQSQDEITYSESTESKYQQEILHLLAIQKRAKINEARQLQNDERCRAINIFQQIPVGLNGILKYSIKGEKTQQYKVFTCYNLIYINYQNGSCYSNTRGTLISIQSGKYIKDDGITDESYYDGPISLTRTLDGYILQTKNYTSNKKQTIQDDKIKLVIDLKLRSFTISIQL
jgi:hypothetical protein